MYIYLSLFKTQLTIFDIFWSANSIMSIIMQWIEIVSSRLIGYNVRSLILVFYIQVWQQTFIFITTEWCYDVSDHEGSDP